MPSAKEPRRYGPYTLLQWAGAAALGAAGVVVLSALVVSGARWLLDLSPVRDYLRTYPGDYPLPALSPTGLPAWLGWQHFFNVFLMVLIIRSGLQVRWEKQPSAYWTPRWGGINKKKISFVLWFHQALDVLWFLNGLVFVVMLFATGHWVRIVPTSWDVFPNAVSAFLQYLSMSPPTHNSWSHYNSLQQLAYFTTVFVAAPLAAISGIRMSGLWPTQAKKLSRLYPIELARAVHVPVMLYFVSFIAIHVFLVLATGALRNLNHIYAADDSESWIGFWIFVASLLVIGAAWTASRPIVLAPIAQLFGKVSRR